MALVSTTVWEATTSIPIGSETQTSAVAMSTATKWTLHVLFEAGTGHISELELRSYWCHSLTGQFVRPACYTAAGVLEVKDGWTTGDIGSGNSLDCVIGASTEEITADHIPRLEVGGSYLKIGVQGTGTDTGAELVLHVEAW
jgi:hypothetical protein